jgi:isoleucyl-tRNA synthetase
VSYVLLDVGPADASDAVRVDVERAPGVKCERCLRYVDVVTTEPDRAGICDRCVDALAEPVNL